jgi:spore germination protein
MSGPSKSTTRWGRRLRRVTPVIGLSLLGLVLALGGFLAASALSPAPGTPHAAGTTHHPKHPASSDEAALGNRSESLGAKAISLPAATAPPAAAPVALVDAPPLAGRENFAFAPYWTLGQSAGFTLTGLSTLDYFAVGVNPDGTLEESGPGWNGFESQALSNLITRAHAAGERVVLTVNDFGQSSLNALTSSASAPATLAAALIPTLESKNLDGVNFDFEGQGSGDQAGLTNLIASVSGSLRAFNPHWQITMDTYASSAGDPGGFYNIGALAPSVDAFFVMAYELNLQGSPNAAAPLTSGMFSDLTTMAQYTAIVPASKVILGAPFFGIDWPTSNGTLAAKATGAATDVADAQIPTSDPAYWDPATDTGWTSYEVGSQWHETYFESPYAAFMIAELATHYGARGVGIWALGMENNGPQLIDALDGFPPPGGPGPTGPASTSASSITPTATAQAPSTTTPAQAAPAPGAGGVTSNTGAQGVTTTTTGASSTTTSAPSITGEYEGSVRHLSPVGSGGVDSGLALGTLTDFSSTNPAYACLDGKTLDVYLYGVLSGNRVAVATTPTDCIDQEFIFPG